MRSRYLLVDGHSVIFAWPELCKLHQRRRSLARDALVKRLRDYQDWTGIHVVAVFDGTGDRISETSGPGELHVIYSKRGQTADSIIERLAGKYAGRFDLTVVTADALERETVHASGANWISPETLRQMIDEVRQR